MNLGIKADAAKEFLPQLQGPRPALASVNISTRSGSQTPFAKLWETVRDPGRS
jgi:hypothetical protein